MGFRLAEEGSIELQVLLGNHTAGDVHLRDRLVIVFAYDIHHARHIHLPSLILLLHQPRIRTEFTVVYTQIGWFDMKIAVEVGQVAMLLFADIVGECTQIAQLAVFIEINPFLESNSLTGKYFFSNRFQSAVESCIIEQEVQFSHSIHTCKGTKCAALCLHSAVTSCKIVYTRSCIIRSTFSSSRRFICS